MVMGNGSNILVTDRGYAGTVIRIGEAFSGIETEGECITAGAGALLSAVAAAAAEAGLAGLEFASGIPGSAGGAVFMNAGAYESEMKDIVSSVSLISQDGRREYELPGAEMKFAYRSSLLQESGDVVTRVKMRLKRGDPGEIKEKMRQFARARSEKQPLSLPSAGSFFKRPHGYFAGKLIEDAGLMGLTVGGAMVSTLHAGFIVNNGNATATDIIDLMRLVQHTVYDKFGVKLEPEVRIVGEF
jgi:UDP-N-acetylmuramate dehydrogenase